MQISRDLRKTFIMLAAMLALLMIAGPVLAVSPTTQTASGWSVSSDGDWFPFPPNTNPLGAPDNNCTGGTKPNGGWAEFTFDPFGIPTGDTVTGIEVRVNYLSISGSNTVQLTDGGSLVGSTRTVASVTGTSACSSTAWTSAVGAMDLWGTSLTTADFNAGNVGFRLTQGANTVEIDAVELIVHHSSGSNTAPVANDDSYNPNEDTPLNVTASGVLGNDTDSENDPLTAVLNTTTSDGTLTLNSDGSFTYDPDLNFCGQDSFTYHANDGTDDSNIATVTIDVTCVNDDPVVSANQASVTVNEGQVAANTGTVSDVDGDSVALSASVGTATNNNDGTWSWSFTTGDGPADSQTVDITANDGNGGIRSTSFTLTVNNVPPTANAGPDQTVYRYDLVSVSGTWTDPAGSLDNPYSWTWDLDEDAVPDSSGNASFGDTVAETTSFALEGFYTLTFAVTDNDAGSDSASLVVEVLNKPPDCSNAGPSIDTLWPPNHRFVAIDVVGVTDPEGDPIVITVDSIFQDEAVDAPGSGNTSPDGQGVGSSTAEVRAERMGAGNGRFYHISYTADDGHGGSCSDEILVGVPKSKGKKGSPVDDGALFDSTTVVP